ncbi:MAG: anthranilate phosphoribosyltransferase [Spirochaeta sp.]|nr:anthranilate phosphoribosyltransferase [Spirochaeta sp.]RPG10611.1 MAG: anthranilate phosphoribosyltransferase [Proteobacteria bacterium TMED72]
MSVQEALASAVASQDVAPALLEAAFSEIMAGESTPALIAALLVALRMKGESVSEIVAAARALRGAAVSLPKAPSNTVDTCGTGGSGRGSFSISTTAAFVVAGAGVPVAKHGNRAVTSRTGGSFDTFEALGVRIDLPIEAYAEILAEIGIAPFFARTAHPAFRHVGPVRAELGVRTLLNCLGPLVNPLGVKHQLVGVYSAELVEPLAGALGALGARRAMVVHGSDGLDELTTAGTSVAAVVEDGVVQTQAVDPEELGLRRVAPDALAGGTPDENADILRRVLHGEKGAQRDIVCLNAAGALYAACAAEGLAEGLSQAEESLDSGAAAEKLSQLIEHTRAVA